MLRGQEHFFQSWRQSLIKVASFGPVLDVGTAEPFKKELGVLKGSVGEPYFCFDYNMAPRISAQVDAHFLPFRDECCGCVIFSHVLEHVADPSKVVAEAFRCLRPGGMAYVTLLDAWPYHAAKGLYPDYHRFKADAVELLFSSWNKVDVLQGGGPIQTIMMNFLPQKMHNRGFAQRLANKIDPGRSGMTPVRYVFATK